MKTLTLKIEGMSCAHCSQTVEKAVNSTGASGRVELDSGTVKISYDENSLNTGSFTEAIEKAGYRVIDETP